MKFKKGDKLVCINKRPWVWIADLETETGGIGPIYNKIYQFDCYTGKFIYSDKEEYFIQLKECDSQYPESCFEKVIEQTAFDKMLNAILKVKKYDY